MSCFELRQILSFVYRDDFPAAMNISAHFREASAPEVAAMHASFEMTDGHKLIKAACKRGALGAFVSFIMHRRWGNSLTKWADDVLARYGYYDLILDALLRFPSANIIPNGLLGAYRGARYDIIRYLETIVLDTKPMSNFAEGVVEKALEGACLSGKWELVMHCLEFKKKLGVKSRFGVHIITDAICKSHNQHIFDMLIALPTYDGLQTFADIVRRDLISVLNIAIRRDFRPMIDALIAVRGARSQIDERTPEWAQCRFYLAAITGDFVGWGADIVRDFQPPMLTGFVGARCIMLFMAIIEAINRANIDMRMREWYEMLEIAVRTKHVPLIKMVLNNVARKKSLPSQWARVLSGACRYTNVEIVALLVHESPRIRGVMTKATIWSGLREACNARRISIVQYLISLGDVDDFEFHLYPYINEMLALRG